MNGDAIAALARSWIGTPYRHQASLKGIGCDCLGLVRGVWREALGPEPQAVPAYSPDWAEAGLREDLLEAAGRHMIARNAGWFEAGDVLLFRWRAHLPAKHAGIAVSSDRMVHAQEGAAACEVAVSNWWRRHLAGVFAFPTSKQIVMPAKAGRWIHIRSATVVYRRPLRGFGSQGTFAVCDCRLR